MDGRPFPWGDAFDATLCNMRDSLAARPAPAAIDAFPDDLSMYGVRGCGGNVRDWCADPRYEGSADRRPTRGGSWGSLARNTRCASRYGFDAWNVNANFGFRLVRDLPG